MEALLVEVEDVGNLLSNPSQDLGLEHSRAVTVKDR